MGSDLKLKRPKLHKRNVRSLRLLVESGQSASGQKLMFSSIPLRQFGVRVA